jgi:hypothetical protein
MRLRRAKLDQMCLGQSLGQPHAALPDLAHVRHHQLLGEERRRARRNPY